MKDVATSVFILAVLFLSDSRTESVKIELGKLSTSFSASFDDDENRATSCMICKEAFERGISDGGQYFEENTFPEVIRKDLQVPFSPWRALMIDRPVPPSMGKLPDDHDYITQFNEWARRLGLSEVMTGDEEMTGINKAIDFCTGTIKKSNSNIKTNWDDRRELNLQPLMWYYVGLIRAFLSASLPLGENSQHWDDYSLQVDVRVQPQIPFGEQAYSESFTQAFHIDTAFDEAKGNCSPLYFVASSALPTYFMKGNFDKMMECVEDEGLKLEWNEIKTAYSVDTSQCKIRGQEMPNPGEEEADGGDDSLTCESLVERVISKGQRCFPAETCFFYNFLGRGLGKGPSDSDGEIRSTTDPAEIPRSDMQRLSSQDIGNLYYRTNYPKSSEACRHNFEAYPSSEKYKLGFMGPYQLHTPSSNWESSTPIDRWFMRFMLVPPKEGTSQCKALKFMYDDTEMVQNEFKFTNTNPSKTIEDLMSEVEDKLKEKHKMEMRPVLDELLMKTNKRKNPCLGKDRNYKPELCYEHIPCLGIDNCCYRIDGSDACKNDDHHCYSDDEEKCPGSAPCKSEESGLCFTMEGSIPMDIMKKSSTTERRKFRHEESKPSLSPSENAEFIELKSNPLIAANDDTAREFASEIWNTFLHPL